MLRYLPSPNRRTLTITFFAALLCLLSFFLGIYNNSLPPIPAPPSDAAACFLPPAAPYTGGATLNFLPPAAPYTGGATLNFLPLHTAESSIPPISSPLPPIPFCTPNFTDYCPCQDLTREARIVPRNLVHRERHCPGPDERVRCRIPRPEGHRPPVPWPESRRSVWFANVPSKKLSKDKADQHWVVVEGDRLVFPGGGTSFVHGVEKYVEEMARLVPLRTGAVRTVLDIGCGVATFGGHLLDYNILTMSVAPRDVHEAQVQFALERGLPAMLGVLSIHKLPYPSRSFDMVHCARCLIPWVDHDGMHLLEIDRILRPGGYWVLSGPPIDWRRFYKGWQRTPQDLEAEQTAIENLAKRLCWKKVAEKGTIAVWQKPTNHIHCTKKSKLLNSPPFCVETDRDAVWNEKIEVCIAPLPKAKDTEEISGGALEKWPERLNVAPRGVSSGSDWISTDTIKHDNQVWKKRVFHYQNYLSSLSGGKYRNIMDMNAGIGGFAAALSKYPVWVMNVAPVGTNSTLGIIYDRGLIGTYMDWCEAFSTYPRTYDLIHAHGIFSMYMDKCDVIDILLEMDRILRPQGAVIIRDHVDVLVKVKASADRLTWQSRIVHSDDGPFHPEKLLIVDNSIANTN